MKITVQHYDMEFSFTQNDDAGIGDMMGVFRKILVCMDYPQELIDECLKEGQ